MGRHAWKTHGITVHKSPDFGELSVTLKEGDKKVSYNAFGEFTVTRDGNETEQHLAVVAISEIACTVYDMEKRTLLAKRALTIPAREVTPRNLAFVLLGLTESAGT
jgi:hypothetical protein